MAEVKVKKETNLSEPAEIENRLVGQCEGTLPLSRWCLLRERGVQNSIYILLWEMRRRKNYGIL